MLGRAGRAGRKSGGLGSARSECWNRDQGRILLSAASPSAVLFHPGSEPAREIAEAVYFVALRMHDTGTGASTSRCVFGLSFAALLIAAAGGDFPGADAAGDGAAADMWGRDDICEIGDVEDAGTSARSGRYERQRHHAGAGRCRGSSGRSRSSRRERRGGHAGPVSVVQIIGIDRSTADRAAAGDDRVGVALNDSADPDAVIVEEAALAEAGQHPDRRDAAARNDQRAVVVGFCRAKGGL